MTSCASLHKKNLFPLLQQHFQFHILALELVDTLQFSYDPGVSVITFANLWSFRTMNSDCAVASSDNLFVLILKNKKNRIYLNKLQIHCYRTCYRSYGVYNKRIVNLILDRMALQDIKSTSSL